MSTRRSRTIESLHETKIVDLGGAGIDNDDVKAPANALKDNTSVWSINLCGNYIGNEGAAAIADALKVNASVTNFDRSHNYRIGHNGVLALVDALKLNTSVTDIDISGNRSFHSNVDKLMARNKSFRSLFLFDARRMLLSLMCADECGVVWPYLLENGDTDGIVAPDDIQTIRAEFAVVVKERCCREAFKQVADLNDIVSGQACQIAELTHRLAKQTNQIGDLQKQVYALSKPREQEPSANVNELDSFSIPL
jgi:hypothetical protein